MSRRFKPPARRLWRVGLLLVLVLLNAPGLVNAEDAITLVSQECTYNFAQSICFTAKFKSLAPITDITLLFAAQGDLRIFKASLPVPGDRTSAQVSYTLDLKEYPLRPFAQVEFWWYVEAADGTTLETAPASFLYADNRYDWHRAADEGIEVYWIADDPALGHTALRIAQDGLERIQTVLPGSLEQTITIYIYPTLEELRSALRLAGRDWVGGHADPEWGVILVSASNGPAASIELQQTIPHEVAHFVIEQSAGGKNNQVPHWLHEGLAVGNETRPDPTFELVLERAVEEHLLFSLETLCASPPADQSDALLFYAQSASLVRYLQNHYGNQLIRQLVAAYGDGADCNGGVERVLGVTLGELEAEWLASLEGEMSPDSRPAADLDGLALWAGLLVGSMALASAFYLFRPRNRKEAKAEQPA